MLSVTACSRFLDVSRTINARVCLVGSPCVSCKRNVKSCVNVVDVSQRSQGKHRCEESRCPICQKYDNPETQRCCSERKRQENDDDNEEEEEEKKKNFLFFDLECIKETGVHLPNLVVVQDDEGNEWDQQVQGLLRLVVWWNHGRVCAQLQRV